jgi:integrase/recombinase XerC
MDRNGEMPHLPPFGSARRFRKRGPSKGTTYPAEHYSRAECLAMINVCGQTWYGRRDAALITVLWRSGLRLAEALALRPKDVNFEESSIRVLHGKGEKARTVGMDEQEAAVIRSWLEIERAGYPTTAPVFCTRKGETIPQSYVRRKFSELARKAGVPKRVHAHGFRHTYAVELMREGVRVRDIQMLLGHANLQVTSVYLASLSPEEALDAVRGRKW